MPPRPLSGPDPSLPLSSATRVLGGGLDEAAFEADFADLAARFAAQSGGGLSPELSAELALEIVLNEVVEQACLATGATGAAIVLQRDGEMVCRASSGATAPELGARLDSASGISGECIRTRRTQRCDDVLADLRADLDASQRLGVRSVMVVPLLVGEEVLGIFELFSSWPRAFGERDELTLQALAGRILKNLSLSDRAAHNPPPTGAGSGSQHSNGAGSESLTDWPQSTLTAEAVTPELGAFREIDDTPVFSSSVPSASTVRGLDFTTGILAAAVIVCVALLGLLLGRHVGAQQGTVRVRQAAASSKAGSNANQASTPVAPAVAPVAQNAPSSTFSSVRSDRGEVPEGSLLVYENGREVFRQTPAPREVASFKDHRPQDHASRQTANNAAVGTPTETTLYSAMPSPGREEGSGAEEIQRAASVSTDPVQSQSQTQPGVVTSVADENDVLARVEPQYPDDARQQKIQGPVVLDVRITPSGRVQEMVLVTGQPLLVQAAKDAVQQWRFKPHNVSGHAAAMQTRVTLNFRLPQ